MNIDILQLELGKTKMGHNCKEDLVMDLINNLAERRDFPGIVALIKQLKDLWPDITSPRITKIIKKMLYILPNDSFNEILLLVTELINWAEDENRNLLKLDLECKRISALLKLKEYSACLESIKSVLKDLKKIDDKESQVKLYICESKAFYELNDLTKAKSSLTAARVLAISTYCSSELQAQIDLLSGMLFCSEGQYSTAYSYFLEAIDGFNLSKEREGELFSIRYLILSKIICKRWTEISAIIKSKIFIPFANDEVVIFLLKIKKSCQERDLKAYQTLLEENEHICNTDSFIKSHLYSLYEILFESNILKIIEPYSNIKISTIADIINFTHEYVEEKLRKMILDVKIKGSIDNVSKCLLLFDTEHNLSTYEDHLNHVKLLNEFLSP